MDCNKAQIPRRICDKVFHQHHESLRHFLNFHSIYPLLNSHRLLSSTLDQSILTSPTLTSEQRVDIMLSWLPKSSRSDYLSPFIKCLLESVEQAGEAHKELAEKMQAQVEREMRNYTADLDSSIDVERDGTTVNGERAKHQEKDHLLGGCYYSVFSPRKRTKSIVMKGCTVCSVLFLLVSVVWIIITVLFIKVIPKNITETNIEVLNSATIFLVSNMEWLESIEVKFSDDSCTGTVAVIEGAGCSNLPIMSTDMEPPGCFHLLRRSFYALQGSSINISVPNNFSSHIWITRTLQVTNELNDQTSGGARTFSCNKNYSNAHCFDTNMTINFPVSKPGFYHSTVTDASDTNVLEFGDLKGVKWACDLRIYNFTAIRDDYSADLNRISGDEAVPVSRSFSFKDSCVLLNFHCGSHDTTITISNLKHRWDIVLLIFIIYFFCVILSVVFVITSITLCLKCKK